MSGREDEIAVLAAVIEDINPDLAAEHFARLLYARGVCVMSEAQLDHQCAWAAAGEKYETLHEVVAALVQLGADAWKNKRDKDAALIRDLIQLFENRESLAAEKLQQYHTLRPLIVVMANPETKDPYKD